MHAAIQTTLIGFTTLILYPLYKKVTLWYSNAHLAGPPHNGSIQGNEIETYNDENGTVVTQWIEKYGSVFGSWELFGIRDVYLADLKGVSYVLKHDRIYQKPESRRYLIGRITGHGVMVMEGDQHRKQRRVMNPAFGSAQIKAMTGTFLEKSAALRDLWATQLDQGTSTACVDILSWLSRATLDVIGQAGFNYQFDALAGEPNELNEAFARMLEAGSSVSLPLLLKLFFPVLRSILPEHNASFRTAHETTLRIGRNLLKQSREAANSRKSQGRDLLSLLIKSNTSTDIPENQRMSDDEVLAQVATFLAVGHETTGTATTWALFALATHPQVQSKLREELSTVSDESPSMDDLNSLPYLGHVVREALRLFCPIYNTARVAMQDDVIPLAEPFMDKYGRSHNELRVKKGQPIAIPNLAINRDKSLWGPDALEFRPERWDNIPEAVTSIPGVWGNMMTFSDGNHACIGWRFGLIEMKALLFTLIRAYEFQLAVPKDDVLIKRAFPVVRPVVRKTIKGGSNELHHELPMIIRAIS